LRLSQVCIDRPVFATVLSLVIVLVGAVSLGRISNRELPDIDAPVVSVTTVFPGAAPEVVETSVTQPIENAVVGIEGVKHVTSLSREQVSQVTVEFVLGRDVDLAANDMRDRVARIQRSLPDEVDPPIVAKLEADASPVLWLAISGDGYSQIQLSTIAETQMRDRLAKLPGVAAVIIGGERRYSMRVWLDNDRLAAQNLTIADVAAALRRENVDIPSGRIEGKDREFTVRTLGELSTAGAFGELIVTDAGARPVRLRDVARVEVGPEDERKLVRFNGVTAVGMGIIKQSKANTLDVVQAAKDELSVLEKDLPPGVRVEAAFDSSIFIKRSIADVSQTIFEAIALVVVVIYLFLRSARATIIPAIAIPVSIVGTFAVLYALDFTINTLTLMGLTLAIGLVVDDAIVVLENVTRWIEDGHTPMEAARRGMEEISFAVVAATVSAVAVFFPLTFLTDTTGRLFREFGVTVATSVAISGFVALTLSPALCARVLRHSAAETGVKAWLARGFELLAAGYARALRPTLLRSPFAVAFGVAWFAFGVWLYQRIPQELVPTADRGTALVFTRAPEGSTIGYTDRYQRLAEEIILSTPEIEKAFSVVALGIGTPGLVNEGGIFTTLKPWEQRSRSQQEVVAELGKKLWDVPGIQAFAVNPSGLGAGFGSPVSIVLQGPEVGPLAGYADEIVQRARQLPGFLNVRSDLLLNKPQLDVHVDRNRASDLGVSVRDVATTLQILLGGLDLSQFKLQGETYKVMAQLEGAERTNARDVLGLYVRGRTGALVPLASVVNVEEGIAARGIPHFDRLRAATVTASLAEGTPLGGALAQIRAVAQEVLPPEGGYRVTFSGESEQFFEAGNALLFAYAFAVVIIYLVLAAQFESFLHPVTILVAVALSFTGALVALRALGDTLNIFSQIGLVMLIGLISKNSILIVEFANQLRERGLGVMEAALEASRTRFRPILMTAVATVVGILPIALGRGAGGEARAPLGVAVVGGMVFATVLTFFVVPATWVLFEHLRARVASRRGSLAPKAAQAASGGR
jgi:multidrug efflux pump